MLLVVVRWVCVPLGLVGSLRGCEGGLSSPNHPRYASKPPQSLCEGLWGLSGVIPPEGVEGSQVPCVSLYWNSRASTSASSLPSASVMKSRPTVRYSAGSSKVWRCVQWVSKE